MRSRPDGGVPQQRWIVVAECPFLPATGGAELEHRGFLQAALEAGVVEAVVMPVKADDGPRTELVRDFLGDVPLITVPRGPLLASLRSPASPFMVASRVGDAALAEQVRAAAPDATGVVAFAYKSHRLGRDLARALRLPIVVRMHNHEGRYYRSIARPGQHRVWPLVLAEALRVEVDERRLERSGDVRGLADISPVDARSRAGRARIPVRYVPSFAFAAPGAARPGAHDGAQDADRPEEPVGEQHDAETPTTKADAPTALFLGALDVQTNVDAVTWLIDSVWPLVRRDLPQARLDVVGRAPLPGVIALTDRADGVSLHADVPATAPYLQRAHLAVNPAVTGSGVNIKLIEYLLAGLPVVSTTRGSAGLGLTQDDGVALADDAAGFAAAMVELLRDPERATRLAQQGRATAQALRDPVPGLRELADLLSDHTSEGAAMPTAMELLKADLRTGYASADSGWARLLPAFLHPRYRALAWYRLAQPLYAKGGPLRSVAMAMSGHVVSLAGADLHPRARVGPGLVVQHSPGIVLGQYVVAGERLTLHQNVTLGDRHPGGGQPTLGDDVTLGAGACVLGPVRVGDGAVIAANAVVLDDVPAGCVVAGAPAKVVRRP